MDAFHRSERAAAQTRVMAARATAYAEAVAHLTTDAWARISTRCAALDSSSAAALIDRALLAARAFELPIPEPVRDRPSLRAIKSAAKVFTTGVMLAYEVGAEFDSRFDDGPKTRTKSSGRAEIDTMVDANLLIESTLAERNAIQPLGAGVITVMRAGEHAVQRHDWMSAENFNAIYQFIEPEIPYSSLTAE